MNLVTDRTSKPDMSAIKDALSRSNRCGESRSRASSIGIALLVTALAMFALVGCYNNNTGETNIGDSIRFKLPAFPETGSNKVQVFTEMHYQPSYRSQEGPRLDVPDSAVPISGKEVVSDLG